MSRRFAIIPARALDDERLIANDILILCALGRHTDKAGWCAVRQSVIAGAVRLSRAYVNRRIKHIAACGYVEKHSQTKAGRGRVANHYRVLFDVSVPPEADVPDKHNGGADVPLANTPPVFTANTAIDEEREQFNEDDVTSSARMRELFSEALGNAANPKSHKLHVLLEPIRWTQGENRCDLHLDLLPTIKRLASIVPPHSISSWNYFRNAVFEARDLRLAKPNNPAPNDLTNERHDTRTAKPNQYLDDITRGAQAAIRKTQLREAKGAFRGRGGDAPRIDSGRIEVEGLSLDALDG